MDRLSALDASFLYGETTLGAKVCPVAAERDIAALDAVFARSRAELGSMDVLICGAAGNFLAPAEKLSANGFKAVVDIDLLVSFNASRAAFEQLKETKGALIYISAGMAYMPHAQYLVAVLADCWRACPAPRQSKYSSMPCRCAVWVRSTISARPPPFLPRHWPPTSPAASLSVMADQISPGRGGLTRVPSRC
jgi:NAD(P)-dependent dehydrogenase (short-subunit alcohol dehydrogenase family)